MNYLNAQAEQALIAFQLCDSWEERTKLLLTYGSKLDDFPLSAKTDINLIKGCNVQSWLIGNCAFCCDFKAYSEAKITKGLLALLLLRINGENKQKLPKLNITKWFLDLGLSKNISASRRDGLQSAFNMMLEIAQ